MTRPVVLHVAAVEFTASRLLRPQLEHLVQLGYDVRLACAPQGQAFSQDLQQFNPVPLSFPRSFRPGAVATGATDLMRLLSQLRPSLVHFHSPAASIPGRAVMAPRRRRPRVVYTVHGFLHTWDRESRRDRILDRSERVLSRWTDALLFQSAEDHDNARHSGYKGHLIYLGNGVGDEWFQSRTVGEERTDMQVVFVGRLTREKGVRELLQAASVLANVRWTLLGDALPSDRDPLASEVHQASARSHGTIVSLGMVTPASVRSHLAKADLLVLPSWREGVPRSVIEGMASGLPVIATDIRGCRELIEPGVNGWLVPPGNGHALTEAIRLAEALPREDLRAMGAAGREKASERFREQGVFERIANTYASLGVHP